MCTLRGKYNSGVCKTVVAYKVVAKRISDGTYHSLAMGCAYPKLGEWGTLPEVKVQKTIGPYFNPDILNKFYNLFMAGRTVALLSLKSAKAYLKHEHDRISRFCVEDNINYEVVLVKVLINEELLTGDYSDVLNGIPACHKTSHKTVAGKQMKIVCEIPVHEIKLQLP